MPSKASSKTVLLVDDDERVLQILKEMVEHFGYRVVAKSNSSEALQAFLEEPERFDLIVTDQSMPGMTGLELAQELLRIRPGIPVIMCSGYCGSVTPDTAESFGLRAFIAKPCGMRELAEAIRRVLG